jgi:hypothetical protein
VLVEGGFIDGFLLSASFSTPVSFLATPSKGGQGAVFVLRVCGVGRFCRLLGGFRLSTPVSFLATPSKGGHGAVFVLRGRGVRVFRRLLGDFKLLAVFLSRTVSRLLKAIYLEDSIGVKNLFVSFSLGAHVVMINDPFAVCVTNGLTSGS